MKKNKDEKKEKRRIIYLVLEAPSQALYDISNFRARPCKKLRSGKG